MKHCCFPSLLISIFVIILNTSAQQQYNIYFGDLHSHTNLSDGMGWLCNVYPMAKTGGADFHALTDHLTPSVMNVNSINRIEWEGMNSEAERNTGAAFVGIAGYEYTTPAVVGHINLFNMEYNATNATILTDFYAHIGRFPDAIGQFNHPTFATDEFNKFAYRTDAADEVMCLIEICGGSNEGSYQLALSKGWHVAPVDNSDTHNADWIQGYANRAVILAQSLTRTDLYDAMKHRRLYASQDKNLKVYFSINGQIMGSRLPQPATLNVEVTANDPDAAAGDRITKVELIGSGGTVAASGTFSSNNVLWRDTLSRASDYYYARITTADGNKAWTAPIWTIAGAVGTGILICDIKATPAAATNTQPTAGSFSAGITDVGGTISRATLDLSPLGGGTAVAMAANGNMWSCSYNVPAGLAPGSKTITLTVTDNDNNQRQRTLLFDVRSPESYLNIYTDAQAIISAGSPGWKDDHGTTFAEVATGAFEGTKCLDIGYVITGFWSGGGFSLTGAPIDASGYDFLRITLRVTTAPHNLGISFAFADGTSSDLLEIPSTTTWNTVDIPIRDWTERGYTMKNIREINFNIDGTQTGSGHAYIDDIKLVKTHNGTSSTHSVIIAKSLTSPMNPVIVDKGNRLVSISAQPGSLVRIHDVRGVLVWEKIVAADTSALQWRPMTPGVYSITVLSAGHVETNSITIR